MHQELRQNHMQDMDGNPAGGTSAATGLAISWQDGPLEVDGLRREPTGCFVETILDAVVGRIEFYQRSKFECPQNARALMHLRLALDALDERTAEREGRGVEGTHQL